MIVLLLLHLFLLICSFELFSFHYVLAYYFVLFHFTESNQNIHTLLWALSKSPTVLHYYFYLN